MVTSVTVASRGRWRLRNGLRLVTAAVLCTSLVGCGGQPADGFERTPVTGTVVLDGEPLQFGEIFLIGAANEKSEAPQVSLTIRDGKFESNSRMQPGTGDNEVMITIYESDPVEARSQGHELRVLGVWQGRTLVRESDPLAFVITARQLQK